jgi:hypothetical protein
MVNIKTSLKSGFDYFVANYFWSGMLFVVSAGREIEVILALIFVMLMQIMPFIVVFAILYVVELKYRGSEKSMDDPKNVSLLDRLPAFIGFLVPIAEYSRYFPAQMGDYKFMVDFEAEFLTGILILLSANQLIPLALQMLTFREIIRRRGPDTQWAGVRVNKIWIKHYIRYWWCYGFLVTTLLEPYAFAQRKLIELVELPYYMDAILSQIAFWFFTFLLGCGLFFMLIGDEKSIPIIHSACIFHVGKPKKKK